MSTYHRLLLLIGLCQWTSAENLRPPYLNLAREKHITVSATSTCGYFVDKDNPNKIDINRELYCKLTGSSPYEKDYKDSNLIYGQYCDYCDPNTPDKKHIVNYTIDGTDRWWQSPPLSRGIEYQKVNITIDLGQEYHIAYVYIRMANSPRPAVWSLERSTDYGKTFSTWYYFASDMECRTVFKMEPFVNRSFVRDDDVVCETKYASRIPLEGGEMVVSLINDRPNIKNFSYSDTLQQWTRATHVRLRLLRPMTLHSHSIVHDSHDKSVTRRYFYSIRDIGIGGHCQCNGHAESCDKPHSKTPNKLVCRCRHNTCGDYCQECCPPFVQKKWRQSRDNRAGAFECEPCQCYGHSTECVYDEEIDQQKLSIDIYGKYEGGGRCLNCQHNTEGINCERCVRGFFRNFTRKVTDIDMCQPCNCNPKVSTGACGEGTGKCECKPQFAGLDCDECAVGYFDYPAGCKPCLCSVNGTADHKCLPDSGRCVCKMNFDGDYCDRCAPGYYNYKAGCLPCQCERAGSDGNICDLETGQCPCRLNYQNRTCDTCKNGHYGYPGCLPCVCNYNGSTIEICDKQSGTCLCKANFTGQTCEQCASGFFNHPTCEPCACDPNGVVHDTCDQRGQCHCKANFGGRQCNQCAPGYYRYPDCIPCECDMHGALGLSCDQTTGQCICKENFVGNKCQECSPGLFNFPHCEECKCVPAGVRNDFPGCGRHNIPGVLCLCKQNVEGRQCDRCKEGYWNMKASNAAGCEPCDCSDSGTLGHLNICDPVSGQCPCKFTTLNSTLRCDICADGYYSLKRDNVFGCEPCHCSLGGSVHGICDKQTGQCVCRPGIVGRECNQPANGHFFASLHHLKYELEDGFTSRHQSPVRYEFDSNLFDNYSWKGYVRYSSLQSEVQLHVQLNKPTAYRMLVRYRTYNRSSTDINSLEYKVPQINVNFASVREPVTVAPQTFDIELPQSDREAVFTTSSNLLTSEAAPNNEYLLTLKTTDPVLIDYIVLIPIDFIEAQALQLIDPYAMGRPCELDDDAECYQYYYPSLNGMPSITNPSTGPGTYSSMVDNIILQELFIDSLATIERGRDYRYDWAISKPGQYYLLIDYHTIDATTSYARINLADGDVTPTSVVLTECPYTFVCRQIVTSLITYGNHRINKPKVMTVTDSRRITLYLNVVQQSDPTSPIGIHKITAVPVSQFNYDLLRPQFSCVRGTSDDGPHGLPVCDDSNRLNNGEISFPVQTFQAEDYHNEHWKMAAIPFVPANTIVVPLNFSMAHTYIYGRLFEPYANPEQYPATFQMYIHYYLSFTQSIQESIPLTVILYSRTGDSQIGELQAVPCQRKSIDSCSQMIVLQNGSTTIRLDEPEFTAYVALNNPNSSIYIDYLTLQRVDRKSLTPIVSSSTKTSEIDRASKFVQECISKAAPNYDPNIEQTSPFCRQALYSLSAAFNERAYPCQCDLRGSTDSSGQCPPFGGQCLCKTNVIGRRCDRCRTGYWGFPNCRPCACPTKICNEITGDCICPPRVTGRYCDQCAARTYGFDPLIGCEDCQCRMEGVVGGRLDCDLKSGQCPCRENLGGRTCDRCISGFYDYPRCMKCDCDYSGTREPVCDTFTGTCLCKEHVYGPRCDRCIEGTFALSTDNSKGCTKCYCFGATSQCHAGTFNYRILRNMSDWTLTRANVRFERREARLTMFINPDSNDLSPIYWSAPRLYLGNKILSYGGNLTFRLSFLSQNMNADHSTQKHPLVILRGRDMTIVHYYNRPLRPNHVDEDVTVTLKEANFRFQTRSSAGVTRETFLQTLTNLTSLHILAWPYAVDSSSSSIVAVQLQNVDLRTTNNVSPSRSLARHIEVCACPPNYAGTSCETCARGYYKQYSGTNGAHSYTCVPCQCNSQSDVCDVETGHCLACQNHTTGKQCELCLPGYHGDPTNNISCRICACPLALESNSFASTCEMNVTTGETTKCFCQQGYYGDRCQSCYPAYWGEPTKMGSRCVQCECNGNIDPFDWNACDQQTGRCVNCLNNTAGTSCERCRDWFYGDAIRVKNCAPCSCSQCGSTRCDSQTGRCQCKPGVTGLTCDVCLENHYGYHACQDDGCKPCDCGLGSIGSSCDLYTGQCQCKPGVGGRKCDVCLPGFWDLTSDGCRPCQCDRFGTVRDLSNTGLSCDAQTGRCYCIEGVRGERCDQCEEYYTIVEGRGCLPCDKSNMVPEGWCARQLIDEVDQLRININRTIDNADRIIQGQTASERIRRMRQRADEYRSLLNSQQSKDRQCRIDVLPSSSFCLHEQILNLTRLIHEFDSQLKQTQSEVEEEQKEAKHLFKRVANEYDRVRDQADKVARFADHIDAFSANLTQNTNEEPIFIVNLIESVAEKVKRFSFEPEKSNIEKRTESISKLYAYLQSTDDNLNEKQRQIEQFSNKTAEFEQRTFHIERHLQNAFEKLQRINDKVDSLNEVTLIRTKLKQSLTLKLSIDEKLKEIDSIFYQNVRESLKNSSKNYQKTLLKVENLNGTIQLLISLIRETIEQNRRVRFDLEKTFVFVESLSSTSSKLEHSFNQMKEQNNLTLLTAFVYKNIIDTVDSLDRTSMELRRNLSDGKEHLFNQRKRLETFEKARFDENFSVPFVSEIELNSRDENRLERGTKSSKTFLQTLKTNEKLLTAYRARIDELNFTAEKLEPDSKRISEESLVTINKFQLLKEKILGEKPMNASSLTDRPLQMEFADINDFVQRVKRWQADSDEKLSFVKVSYDENVNLHLSLIEIISDIRRLVDESRSIVSSVRVGASFNGSSYVNLHRPYSKSQVNLNKQHSKIALSFRTSAPGGLLAYAGLENNDRYMSLRLNEQGQIEFTYDLGQQRPTSIVTSRSFNDQLWYDVTAERIASHGHLLIVDGNGTEVFSGTSDAETGGQSILDLSEENSRFLIGGVPRFLSLKQSYSSFVGSISNVRLDDQAVSLWNFQSAHNYNQGSIPSVIHREALPGIGLKGDGYVIFSKRRLRRLEHSFLLTIIFKTNTPTGLLFAFGGGDIEKRFFAVQIIDSHPEVLMNTGSGLVSLRLEANVYDNQLHRLKIKKSGTDLIVQLDNQQEESVSDRDEESRIEAGNDNIYVGKYLGQDSLRDAITSRGFSGCIQSILIDRVELTFKSEHFKRSENVETTCSLEQILRTVHFNYLDQESYVEVSEKNLTIPWSITARFHSNQPSGTLIYMDNENQPDKRLIIDFDQHHLIVKDANLPLIRCENNLSTQWWNYISIYRDALSYRLYLNDTECGKFDIDTEQGTLEIYQRIFIGGLPQTITEYRPRLIGCIGDVNIDGNFINFNQVARLKNAEQNCQMNGLTITTSNNQRDSIVYPSFDYNGTQTHIPGVYQLKLLEFTDDFLSQTKNHSLPILNNETSSISTTLTIPLINDNDDENDEDEETSRQTRGRCFLSTNPSVDRGQATGYRFGDDFRPSSTRILLQTQSIKNLMNFSMKFRTRFSSGLLFYSGTDYDSIATSNEFIALWLHRARLLFAFDCGSGKAEIETIHRFNDDKWHQVEIRRYGNNATLFVDSRMEGVLIPPGTKTSLETDGIFYFGNVPSDPAFQSKRRRQLNHFKSKQHHLQFQGCLNDIQINNQQSNFDTSSTNGNLRTCFEHDESGVFFNGKKEIQLENSFPLGQRFNISFQFKSRVKTGLLLAAISNNDDNYVFVYLDKGNIVVTLLQNNIDEVHLVHWPNDSNDSEMCDGQWHMINIQKESTSLRLHVDHYEIDEEILNNEFDMNTDGPLYVAGMNNPPAIIDDISPYIGCITNMVIVSIDNDYDDHSSIRRSKPLHAVTNIEHSCPTN